MKFLLITAFWIIFAPLIAAQSKPVKPTQDAAQTANAKPALDDLPQTTLEFKPVGDGLPVSADDGFIGKPFCSAGGTLYFNASLPPDGKQQAVLTVSPKGEVNSYSLRPVTGLANVIPQLNIDAKGTDIYAVVQAEKSEDLLNHDIKPDSPEARRGKYAKYFLLHFSGQLSAPDEIPLDLPFSPSKFAALSKDEFIFLGYLRASQSPVLAVVDGSGQFQRYIDAYREIGGGDSIVAHAQQGLTKSQMQNMPQGPQLGWALSSAQFVHQGDSLLLLIPGPDAQVFTIRGDGPVESTALHLPAGVVAESLIPSGNNWYVRVRNGYQLQDHLILKVNPSDGKVIQIIHSPQLPVFLISCVRNGDYYGIHWSGEKGNQKMFIMEAAQ